MSGMDMLNDEALDRIIAGGAWATEGEAVLMARELLAHRRASQAAPAPSDRLREALALLMQTPFEPSLAYHVKMVCEAVGKKLDADDAALSASPAQEGGE